jgi:hypothetical protein
MKKNAKAKTVLLQTALAAALATMYGSAFAGTISSPAADSSATVYATEALTSSTVVTTPSITYTMGVNRAIGQDFTIVFTPSAGSTFVPGNCVAANFSTAGVAGAFTFSTKRSSASECAIQVGVVSATTTTQTITSSGTGQGLVLATHPLATAGGSVSYTVNLWDLGETARIDNSAELTRVVATSVNAINVYAAASDTITTADVNNVNGPLKGFVAEGTAPADTTSVAAAYLTFDNNTVAAKIADGTTNFSILTTTGTVTVALTDATASFSGLATGKLCLDKDADGTYCETGEVFPAAVSGTATLATIPAAAFPAVTTAATRAISFQANGTTSLGTSRTIAVAGTVTPQVGAAHAFADTASKNATAWVWSANAIELWTPYFSTASGWISRFAFQNTGIAVGYSATCAAEVGNTVENGASVTGTLQPGMTMINAADVCTFSGNTRGNVRFIINAPVGAIHGTYNLVNATTGSSTVAEMTRPFSGTTY